MVGWQELRASKELRASTIYILCQKSMKNTNKDTDKKVCLKYLQNNREEVDFIVKLQAGCLQPF